MLLLIIQKYPSYNENNENLNQLVGLFKQDSLKVLCEAGKVNPIWCQYKQLLELNSAKEQLRKMVTKRSASSTKCWPGLTRPCKGFVSTRLARAAVSESEDVANNDEQKREAAMKCRPGMANCRGKGKREFEIKPKTNDCPQGWLFCL